MGWMHIAETSNLVGFIHI